MKVDNEFLQKFVGGLFYFRFVCFEVGPDWHYLFRYKIIEIGMTENGGLKFLGEVLPLNRFTAGEWINHPTKGRGRVFKKGTDYVRGKKVDLPLFVQVSLTILYVKIDNVAEAVMYANPQEEPDPIECFKHFPEGYESAAGLGGFSGL